MMTINLLLPRLETHLFYYSSTETKRNLMIVMAQLQVSISSAGHKLIIIIIQMMVKMLDGRR